MSFLEEYLKLVRKPVDDRTAEDSERLDMLWWKLTDAEQELVEDKLQGG